MTWCLPCQRAGARVITRQAEVARPGSLSGPGRRLPCHRGGVLLEDDAPGGHHGYGRFVRTLSNGQRAPVPPLTKRLRPKHWAALDYLAGALLGIILFAAV